MIQARVRVVDDAELMTAPLDGSKRDMTIGRVFVTGRLRAT
jgi:hypothetical protein